MRTAILFVLCVVFSSFISAQECAVILIPRPNSVECGTGAFRLDKHTKIVAADNSSKQNAQILNDFLKRNYDFSLKITSKPQKKNAIVFITALPTAGVMPDPESYGLEVERDFVRISGSDRGQFYALQSVMQLLPVDKANSIEIPAVKIADAPRFAYRGMHLDVARHFQRVSFVKKFIDLMSQYKFNQFHWHLTDDQGWRIEIKKYPKLTEIGSIRPETMKEKNFQPYFGDGVPHGGFYTQEQIKDVVTYAKARHLNVIPEIELPGHASAALAAYPQFGCKADYKYKVQTTWGIFKEVYCPTEETFKFLEDVLEETISLFPDSPYIHIGGDEVLKDHWKESAFVQELMKRENLKDEHEVQSYFVRRIEKFINAKGKKIIGWDEILEGGLAPNATVMSWRGMKGGIEAAKSKHNVIMTPTDFAYLDYGQGDPNYEPINIGNHLPLEKVYSFEPIPKELSANEAKYIIGGQGNIWTEYMKTPDKVEYMAFPRMLALSEALWTKPENKNYADFSRRLTAQFARLDKQNVNYRIPEPIGLSNSILKKNELYLLDLGSSVPNAKIFYTVDGSTPDEKSSQFISPHLISPDSGGTVEIKTITVLPNGKKSSVYTALITRREILQPLELAESKPGVNFTFSGVDLDPGTDDFWGSKGESKSILLNQFEKTYDLKKPFVVTFDGYLKIPQDGIYEFQIDSTWDTTLIVGDRKIIDDVGTAEKKIRFAIVPLKAGLHKISFRYNHRGGPGDLALRMGLKGQGLRRVYGDNLFH